MKTFTYTITDPVGIHARPAGVLAKTAKTFDCKLTIEKDGKAVELKKLIAVMGLGVKCGDTITITADGADEASALAAIQKIVSETL